MRSASPGLLAAGLLCVQGTAKAADPFTGLVPMAESELDRCRGRLSVAGYELELGISIDLDGARIAQFATDPAALEDALRSAGGPYRDLLVTRSGSEGSVVIVQNSADDVTLRQTLTLDILVRSIPGPASHRTGATVRDIAPPAAFSSF